MLTDGVRTRPEFNYLPHRWSSARSMRAMYTQAAADARCQAIWGWTTCAQGTAGTDARDAGVTQGQERRGGQEKSDRPAQIGTDGRVSTRQLPPQPKQRHGLGRDDGVPGGRGDERQHGTAAGEQDEERRPPIAPRGAPVHERRGQQQAGEQRYRGQVELLEHRRERGVEQHRGGSEQGQYGREETCGPSGRRAVELVPDDDRRNQAGESGQGLAGVRQQPGDVGLAGVVRGPLECTPRSPASTCGSLPCRGRQGDGAPSRAAPRVASKSSHALSTSSPKRLPIVTHSS